MKLSNTVQPAPAILLMSFASQITKWQIQHGRHNLPWQGEKEPYRIWIAEVMLQQTQVLTVIPYYKRFLKRFPDIKTLAFSTQENVITYWAGLGYYARARNLHLCAQKIVQVWGGRFPLRSRDIATLPGTGRSTASAIAAFAYGERCTILDGNVKRIFTRYFGISGDPSQKVVEQKLWRLAQAQIDIEPHLDMTAYIQGLMDLGALVCKYRNPLCHTCPLQKRCVAKLESRQEELPTQKARRRKSERHIGMLILEKADSILLLKRPAKGVWGGLWSLPEFPIIGGSISIDEAVENYLSSLKIAHQECYRLPEFIHNLTHYRLTIQPFYTKLFSHSTLDELSLMQYWAVKNELNSLGTPVPVKRILIKLFSSYTFLSK